MMTLPLILQLAITNPGGMFSRKLFILLAAFKAVSVLAQVREAKNWVQPTAIKMSRSAWECLLLGLYGLPISVGLLFFPDRVASYFYNFHPPLQVVEIDPLMRFCFRFEGAQLTAFAITVLGEVKNLPKTCLGLCRLLFSLLILLYLRAFADESGSINNGFFRINFAIHVGLITATWCRTLWWLSDDEMIEEHGAAAYHMPLISKKKKSLSEPNVPALAAEADKKRTLSQKCLSDIDYSSPLATAQDPRLY
jgi:hypothetical protein